MRTCLRKVVEVVLLLRWVAVKWVCPVVRTCLPFVVKVCQPSVFPLVPLI